MSESKELVIVPRSIDELVSLSDKLSKATTLNAELRDKPANVMAAIMAGAELGFSPMASLRSVHIIKGIPKLSAAAMVAAVLASGKAQYFEPTEITATSATWVTKRVGSSREQSCTWTSEDAKRAGLTSDNHRLYPRQMLSSRASSELARNIYSDVLSGVYTDDEIPDDREPVASVPRRQEAVDAEVVSETTEDLARLCAEAPTLEALEALTERCAALPDGPKRTAARKAYGARMSQLEKATAA